MREADFLGVGAFRGKWAARTLRLFFPTEFAGQAAHQLGEVLSLGLGHQMFQTGTSAVGVINGAVHQAETPGAAKRRRVQRNGVAAQ